MIRLFFLREGIVASMQPAGEGRKDLKKLCKN